MNRGFGFVEEERLRLRARLAGAAEKGNGHEIP
jgi:hypothetical protein